MDTSDKELAEKEYQKELRKEFYSVMDEKEPFGNEYHEELFQWMLGKISRLHEKIKLLEDQLQWAKEKSKSQF